MSSPVVSTLAFLASSFSSMYLLSTRVIAARRPVRCVPPSFCGMLLVKQSTRLLVGIVPLHRHFDRDAVLLAVAEEHVRMQHVLRAVHVLDEALHAAGEGEVLFLAGALVDQHDLDAVVEERKLAQAPRQDVVVIVDVAEDLLRGEEMHLGAAPLAAGR